MILDTIIRDVCSQRSIVYTKLNEEHAAEIRAQLQHAKAPVKNKVASLPEIDTSRPDIIEEEPEPVQEDAGAVSK